MRLLTRRSSLPLAWTLCALALPAACHSTSTGARTGSTGSTTPAALGPISSPAALAPLAPPSAAELRAYTDGANTFGWELYNRLRAAPGNMVFSPASIAVAFGMTLGGARGDTSAEMSRVLHFPADADAAHRAAGTLVRAWNTGAAGFELRTANRLFGQRDYPFEAPFIALTRDTYGAPLEPVDFRAAPDPNRVRINTWVAEQTRQRITDLLPPGSINGDTRLVLTNAIYLHADWAAPFERAATSDAPFQVNAGDTPRVPTMHDSGSYEYVHRDGVRVLTLRYRDSRYAMSFVLPDATDGLDAALAALDAPRLSALLDAAQRTRVDVALPRFRVEPRDPVRLKNTLMAMGMRLAFDPSTADFTAMATPPDPSRRLYIFDAFHKAFVAVDERGTEAAAATAVVMAEGTGAAMPSGPPPEVFNADHPFLFALRDTQSGALLFLGHVRDPR